MQRLVPHWILTGLLIILGTFAVGCGMPTPYETNAPGQQAQALSSFQSLAQSTFDRVQPHPLLQWDTARQPLNAPAPLYATNQGAGQVVSLRYVAFQVDWRGEKYIVSTDLRALDFTMSIRRLALPMRLQCIPGKVVKANKVVLEQLGIVGLQHNKPQSQSDLVKFELDAKALAHQVWTPMSQLWQLARCGSQLRCKSEIFSDITLDYQSDPQFNCKMTLLVSKKAAP